MAERITMQLVRAGRGEDIVVEAGGDDADAAAAAFDAAVAAHSKPIKGPVLVRVLRALNRGGAVIHGNLADSYDEAKAAFDAAKEQYFSEPGGWGSG